LSLPRHDLHALDFTGSSRRVDRRRIHALDRHRHCASYLTALSWADLTFVLPATAFGNIIVAFLSRFWLHETISPSRWAGIALITLGVGFVAQGPSLTERANPAEEDSTLEEAQTR
jgi:hypothetical protein